MVVDGGAPPRLGRDGAEAPPVRAVHLGLGAFHRAHQAWYTHHAGDGWGIAAFTGRSPDAAVPLVEQQGLYTVLTREAAGDRAEVVSSISAAHDGADAVAWVRHLADPAVGVLTLTVTEAGYRRGPDGGLDTADPAVRADLDAAHAGALGTTGGAGRAATPRAGHATTAPVRLALGLAARRCADAGPLAVVGCDNLPGNGEVARRVVLDACEAIDPGLASWAEQHVSFVSTVVDRITPATARDDLAVAQRLTGRRDEAAVVTEPFTEWVLAGAFPAGRPDWERAGAVVVDDVTPFEQRKLWLLNGAHSLLAYAGPLRGHATVADAVTDQTCRAWVEELWDDAAPLLAQDAHDVAAYREALLVRFANPRLRHRLAQIATGGSQKVPARVLPVVRARREGGHVPTGELRALAAWLLHLRSGDVLAQDRGAQRLVGAVTGPLPEAVRRALEVVAPDLADDDAVVGAVVDLAGETDRTAVAR